MTIVVGVATPQGLVLASDSRTTTFHGGQRQRHRIASDNMQKVFRVGEMGVATFGDAFIGEDTIAGVLDKFEAQATPQQQPDVASFADELGKFVDDRYRAAHGSQLTQGQYTLGLIVAGYEASGTGRFVDIAIPGPDITQPGLDTSSGGAIWRGQTDVIRRLIKGVDQDTLTAVSATAPCADVATAMGSLEYRPNAPITVQDGVDYAAFLVRTTIDTQRFTDGMHCMPGAVPTCGGPPQILAIERSSHTWVEALTLSPPSHPGAAEGAG